MITRIGLVILAALLIIWAQASADWSYDEMRSTIEKGVSYDQMKELEGKFKRKIIEGEGYILLVKPSEEINGWDVHILNKYEDGVSKFLGDVCVVIPEGSPYSERAKKLTAGEKVSFGGSVDRIFGKTIVLKGSAKIE